MWTLSPIVRSRLVHYGLEQCAILVSGSTGAQVRQWDQSTFASFSIRKCDAFCGAQASWSAISSCRSPRRPTRQLRSLVQCG